MRDKQHLFKEFGIRATKQRLLVLDLLMEEQMPISVEQIFLKVKAQDESINLSTVYRILSTFTEKGIALKSLLGESSVAYYELNRMVHKHHLICLSCHKIMNINHCPLENYEKELQRTTAFEVVSHKLEIYGYCPECKSKH